MSRSRAAVGVAVWLGVVLLGSTLVWGVISRVGGELDPQSYLADQVAEPSTSPGGPRSAHTFVRVPRSERSGRERAPQQAGEDEPVTEPSPSAPTGSSSPGAGSPTGTGSASGSSAPAKRSDTWTGSPGSVRATCRGVDLVDWSVSPDIGWKLETEHEHEGLRAKFEHGDDGREVEVTATCEAGRPHFDVRGEDEED